MIFVYFYVLQLILRPQDFSPVFLGWPVAWMTVFPGFLLGMLLNGEVLFRKRIPQFYLLPCFLGIIFVSTVFNAGPMEFYPPTAIFLKRMLVFYMVVFLITSEEKLRGVLCLFMMLAGLLGLHAVLQLTTGKGFGDIAPLVQYCPPRAVWCGEWDGSNSFGVIFLLAIPICLEFLFSRSAPLYRVTASLSLPLAAMGIYYVDSRGDTLALMACLLLYLVMRFFNRKLVLALVAVCVLTGVVLPSRMAQMDTAESSARQRSWVWEQGIDLLRDNPLLGVGPGRFLKHTESGLVAHSNYVNSFSETGMLGFFAFMAIVWFTFKGLFAVMAGREAAAGIHGTGIHRFRDMLFLLLSYRGGQTDREPDLARALLCSLVGFCVATMFIVLMNDLFFFLLGLCAALFLVSRRIEGNRSLRFTTGDLKIVLILMAGILLLYWLVAVYEII